MSFIVAHVPDDWQREARTKSRRETCLNEIMKGDASQGDKAAAAAKSEIIEGDKLGRQGGRGSKNEVTNSSGRQERNHEGKQVWETRRQQQSEIIKGDKLGRQSGSGSQERNHEGRQAWETRRQRYEGGQAWETRRQRQLRAPQNGDHEERQTWDTMYGSSGITTIWWFRGSATQALRSKNPYSFRLSEEKTLQNIVKLRLLPCLCLCHWATRGHQECPHLHNVSYKGWLLVHASQASSPLSCHPCRRSRLVLAA